MTNISKIGVARHEIAVSNYKNGHDAGYRDGHRDAAEKNLAVGFWAGIAVSATLVLIVWGTIFLGTK